MTLHWSAVRGAIQVAELLLHESARVNEIGATTTLVLSVMLKFAGEIAHYHKLPLSSPPPPPPLKEREEVLEMSVSPIQVDIVVSKDGNGTYKKIPDAIKAVLGYNSVVARV
uniref:Uncharacterized protein n=1 Tax=Nelumbo nucifera TaxID=4432 RepID=A0A822ZDS3_NELNU|nr:TPA_asm: hypothetical protein HUJ06_000890 [Nelumbo nucifera]